MVRIPDSIFSILENFEISTSQLVILSSYFTTKHDPNRNTKQVNNSFSYIEPWYNSIMEFDLKAFVFHDSLSPDFIEKYQNNNIRFIKCTLGWGSLNDERFFVYLEFLEKLDYNWFILCTDINDVVINKNPLELFLINPEKLFVGRGDRKNWGSSPWNIEKIKSFNSISGSKLPSGFFLYPVFNAGLIGGKINVIINLFRLMINEFEKIKDEGNHNMAVLNYVIYKNFFTKKSIWDKLIGFSIAGLFFRYRYLMERKLNKKNLDNINFSIPHQGVINSDLILSGFPFNSMFKKFELKGESKAFLIHK